MVARGILWALFIGFFATHFAYMAEGGNLTQVERSWFGRFLNPWPTWTDLRIRAAFVLGFTSGASDCSPDPADPRLDTLLPVHRPVWRCGGVNGDSEAAAAANRSGGVRVTWLGHASLLVAVDGARILCDPIFSERCSASQVIGPRRYRPPPCTIEELPHVDAVVISHNHYDHLDVESVRAIARRFPHAYWFVPSGLRDFVLSTVAKGHVDAQRVHELLWWQERLIGDTGVKVVLTPAQHWSARNLIFDSFSTLWGGWAVIGPKHRFFFAGDTGYCSVFKEIGGHLGPFDVSAIPIGAYEPRWVLKPQHLNPEEAVQVHKDIGAKHSIGIHWGTFPLSHESYMAPKLELEKAVKEAGLTAADFRVVEHGQTLCYDRERPDEVSLE